MVSINFDTLNTQHSTLNTQHSTLNTQLSIILVVFLTFFNFSCDFKSKISTLSFFLSENVYQELEESDSQSQNDCLLKVEISRRNFTTPLKQVWEINLESIKNQSYTIENLPSGLSLDIFIYIVKNNEIIYKSENKNVVLEPGLVELEVNLKSTKSKSENESEKDNAPEGFVTVKGGTVTGATNEKMTDGVFVEGRTVTLNDFYMSKYEVTQAEYREVMQNQTVKVGNKTYGLKSEPSRCTKENVSSFGVDSSSGYDDRPVDSVTPYDAIYFCNAKSEKDGLEKVYEITVTGTNYTNANTTNLNITGATVTCDLTKNGYRLPTEVEWEYAARGGNPNAKEWNYTFSGIDSKKVYLESSKIICDDALDEVAWYNGNNDTGITSGNKATDSVSGMGSHKVGSKKPNSLGIYDMSGNVDEWCWDYYSRTITSDYPITGTTTQGTRVSRGGSWYDESNDCTVTHRSGRSPTTWNYVGFRIVRNAQ